MRLQLWSGVSESRIVRITRILRVLLPEGHRKEKHQRLSKKNILSFGQITRQYQSQ